MNVDACYQLGYIIKPHGLKGEVGILLDVDYPDVYRELESVFVEMNNNLVPFFIEWISVKNNKKAVVKFEEIDSFEQAEALQSFNLYLPLENLPPLKGNQFYYHEVVGFQIVDLNIGHLGKISTIYTHPGQDLISMEYQGKEVLIPINDDVVKHLDRDKQQLTVALPQGLLDVYLDS
ncbi:ribosome maturation factor RimM [Fulvivirgaceae bacterium BMA10]|uniref:Ribosome maturation factor RimM n=1 Tax=Splendidivirga corallicola TaxID=3051826 RepID=A0ABT8KNK7_9BACT|nr:ribosome maturation factor RimM [Fulvivirgaceae bacterium BMA10]